MEEWMGLRSYMLYPIRYSAVFDQIPDEDTRGSDVLPVFPFLSVKG